MSSVAKKALSKEKLAAQVARMYGHKMPQTDKIRALEGPAALNFLQTASDNQWRLDHQDCFRLQSMLINQPNGLISYAGFKLVNEMGRKIDPDIMIKMLVSQNDTAVAYCEYLKHKDAPIREYKKLPVVQLLNALMGVRQVDEAIDVYNHAKSRHVRIPAKSWYRLVTQAIETRKFDKLMDLDGFNEAAISHLPVPTLYELVHLAIANGNAAIAKRGMGVVVDKVGEIPGEIIYDLAALSQQDIVPRLDLLQQLCPEIELSQIPVDDYKESVGRRLSGYPMELKTLVMNYQVRAARVCKSPTKAFQVYQEMRQLDIVPNTDTLRQLVNAAFVMGNSKKLSYCIYLECLRFDVAPTTQIFETLLKIATTGKHFNSVFFWLKMMREHKVPLRQHTHHRLWKRFNRLKDQQYVNIIKDPTLLSYYKFPTDEDLINSSSRSNTLPYSAKRDFDNCKDFKNGWSKDHVQE